MRNNTKIKTKTVLKLKILRKLLCLLYFFFLLHTHNILLPLINCFNVVIVSICFVSFLCICVCGCVCLYVFKTVADC